MNPRKALMNMFEGQRAVAVMKDGTRRTLTTAMFGHADDEPDDCWLGWSWRRQEVLCSEIESVEPIAS